jgi:septal ring factor EnvC (AmiA/AmiB activator)
MIDEINSQKTTIDQNIKDLNKSIAKKEAEIKRDANMIKIYRRYIKTLNLLLENENKN